MPHMIANASNTLALRCNDCPLIMNSIKIAALRVAANSFWVVRRPGLPLVRSRLIGRFDIESGSPPVPVFAAGIRGGRLSIDTKLWSRQSAPTIGIVRENNVYRRRMDSSKACRNESAPGKSDPRRSRLRKNPV